MDRKPWLLNTLLAALVALVFACAEDSEKQWPSSETDVPASNEESDYWRPIITRADGRTETVVSSEHPTICGAEDNPKVLLFCGRGVVGQDGNPPPYWDFLRVNIGVGDTYTIELPAWVTPEPTPTTPTPTVASP
jgi:hypothetical protein